MKQFITLFGILFLLSSIIYSQDTTDFSSNLGQINNTIKEVAIDVTKFEQNFEVLNAESNKLLLTITKTDSKGKISEKSYEFYLGDMDENTVKMEVKGKMIFVNLDTKNLQKLIKVIIDGELQNYVSTLNIHAGEIDGARDMVDIFKNTIPGSRKDKETWPNLEAALKWFNTSVGEVTVDDKNYKQSFEFDQAKQYLITYTSITLDSKGSSIEEIYEFNFSDINKNLTEFKVYGKTLSVTLFTKSKQNLIKLTKNGELQNYTSVIKIYVDDVELARNLINATEFTVPLCKTEFKSWQSAEEALNWLTQNIGEISYATYNYKQSLEVDPGEAGILKFSSLRTDSKSKNTKEVSEFYLPDMNENSVELKITGKTLTIGLKTKNNEKVIKAYKDDILQNYMSGFSIHSDELETAREIINALQYAIPARNNGIKTWSDLPDALNWLTTTIGDISSGGEEVGQEVEYVKEKSNKMVFLSETKDSKGNTIKNQYEIYLSDLSKTNIVLKIIGKKLFVNLETKSRNKYIKALKNNELQSYTSILNIQAEDVLVARNITEALKFAIPLSENSNQMWGDINSTINWVKNAIGAVDAGNYKYLQSIEFEEGSSCLIKLKSIREDSKGNELEEIFEFSLSDINKNLIGFSVAGKIVKAVLITNNKEKHIKYYKNGELQNYAYKLNIMMNDIQDTKDIVLAFKELISECQ